MKLVSIAEAQPSMFQTGNKGTIKRREYKINAKLFLFLSESTLSKDTHKRAEYQRKFIFSLYSRAEVSYLKLRRKNDITTKKQEILTSGVTIVNLLIC